ncbi:DUF2933 domain-containing protein [Modicisalibacter radicis]|uniref:DUF2933 domain-containing protein n=1 Tax=Halomonas sp. EAR18 TaxID=2518972 RepID=UPI00109C0732|nr:DUF2933 domain-containing protein [Halomonas sp. EAR18]
MAHDKHWLERRPTRLQIGLVAGLVGLIIVTLLWDTHKALFLSAAPWLLVLACPLMHLLMHGGHHHGPKGKMRDDE